MLIIKDYFSKNGFDDGDDADLLRVAASSRSKVVRRLNREFVRRGLPYKAQPVDYGTGHNPVRLRLVWSTEGQAFEWDFYYGTRVWQSRERTWKNVGYGFPPGVGEVLEAIQLRFRP